MNRIIKRHWMSKPPAGTQIDWTNPTTKGLVGCWLFNEGAGIIANDLSGNNNHGSLKNMAVNSATSGWCGSKSGYGLAFDKTDDYIDTGPGAASRTGDLTIEAVAYKIDAASTGALVATRNSKNDFTRPYDLYIQALVPIFYLGTGVATVSAVSAVSVIINTRNQVVGTISSNDILIYLNGVSTGSNTFVGTRQTNTKLTIGAADIIGTREFNGIIELVRIWNRALSATEIKSLYAQPYMMFKR